MGSAKRVLIAPVSPSNTILRIAEPVALTIPMLSDDGTGPVWVEAPTPTGMAAGTSFPGGPSSGDLFYRSDLHLQFFYDGTRWLSLSQYTMALSRAGDATEPATATKNAGYWEPLLETIYIEAVYVGFYVAGGASALSGSHKWVLTLTVWDSAGSQGAAIATINIDSGSSSVFRALSATSVNTATLASDTLVSTNITKTGSPGNLYAKARLVYRLIAT